VSFISQAHTSTGSIADFDALSGLCYYVSCGRLSARCGALLHKLEVEVVAV